MTKETLMQMGLTEEQAGKVMEALNGAYVPKNRFNEVNRELQTAKSTIKERDEQLETLRKSTGDVEGLRNQISQLQAENEQKDKDHKAALTKMQREAVDNELLSRAKARNNKAVLALLDEIPDDVEISEYRTRRSEQIDAASASKDKGFLFYTDTAPTAPTVAGASPAGSVTTNPDPKTGSYETRLSEARKAGNAAQVVSIKREAAADGVILY